MKKHIIDSGVSDNRVRIGSLIQANDGQVAVVVRLSLITHAGVSLTYGVLVY